MSHARLPPSSLVCRCWGETAHAPLHARLAQKQVLLVLALRLLQLRGGAWGWSEELEGSLSSRPPGRASWGGSSQQQRQAPLCLVAWRLQLCGWASQAQSPPPPASVIRRVPGTSGHAAHHIESQQKQLYRHHDRTVSSSVNLRDHSCSNVAIMENVRVNMALSHRCVRLCKVQ